MSPERNPLLHESSATGPKLAAECIRLDTLAKRARALDALDQRLRHLLPAALARETRLADVRDGRIVFLASSPTWASRLRLHQAALLAETRTAIGGAVERFAIKVAPLPSVPPEPARPKPLSADAATHLKRTAGLIADPELRAVLLSLASLADAASPSDAKAGQPASFCSDPPNHSETD